MNMGRLFFNRARVSILALLACAHVLLMSAALLGWVEWVHAGIVGLGFALTAIAVALVGELRMRREIELLTAAAQRLTMGYIDEHTDLPGDIRSVQRLQAAADALQQRWDALHQAELRYHALVEQTPVIFYSHTPKLSGGAFYVSPMVEQILGFSTDEWHNDPDLWRKQLHPDDRASVLAQAHTDAAARHPTAIEYRIYTRDGNVRWFYDTAMMVRDKNGHAQALSGVMIDVTERKQTEEMQRLMSAAVQETFDSIIITTADLKQPGPQIVFANDAFTKMTGYTAEEVIGKTPRILQGPDTDRSLLNQLTHALEQQLPFQGETINYRKDGSQFTVEWDITPIHDYSGAITHYVAIQRDVTERRRIESALCNSELRYRTIITNTPVILFAADQNGCLTYIEGKGLERLHCTSEELLNQPLATLRTPAPAFADSIVRALNGEELISILPIGDITFECSCAPLRDDQHNIIGVIGVATDVSDLAQTKQALVENEAKLRTIVENSTDAIYIKDRQGRYVLVNPAAARYLQRPIEYIIGKSDVEITGQIIGAPLRANDQHVMTSGASHTFEERLIVDGVEHTFLTSKFPYVASNGEILGIIGVSRDITDRRHAEDILQTAYAQVTDMAHRLNYSRSVLQTLFDGLNDGLVLLNHLGRIVAINRTLADMLSSTPAVLEGAIWAEVCRRANPTFPGEWATQVVRDGKTDRQRIPFTDSSNKRRVLDMHILPLISSSGTADHVIIHMVDITERLELEAMVVHQERLAASGKLAATVAHEVNSPLQAIQNFLYMAQSAPDSKRAGYLHLVHEEIERIGKIIHHLQDLYRPITTARAPTNINILIERMLLLTGSSIAGNNVNVQCDLASDLPTISIQPDLITQVLLNLLFNALDAMPNGGTLRVYSAVQSATSTHDAAEPTYSDVIVEISDTGVGMTPDVQEHIFDPFFTTKSSGTGLGLAISQQIITQHGGKIQVRSAPNQGSIFSIVLPFADEVIEYKQ
jgi:PAS domain S-box-containing protein